MINKDSKLLVGDKSLSKGYIVNKVKPELDGENAFQRYSEILEDETGLAVYKEDFFTYAKEYPFGIMNGNNLEVIVRDPIAVNDDLDIICIADIPKECNLFVLSGNAKTLLESSLTIVIR